MDRCGDIVDVDEVPHLAAVAVHLQRTAPEEAVQERRHHASLAAIALTGAVDVSGAQDGVRQAGGADEHLGQQLVPSIKALGPGRSVFSGRGFAVAINSAS